MNEEQKIKQWEIEFDDSFPEGERTGYDAFPFPLNAIEREALKSFIRTWIEAYATSKAKEAVGKLYKEIERHYKIANGFGSEYQAGQNFIIEEVDDYVQKLRELEGEDKPKEEEE